MSAINKFCSLLFSSWRGWGEISSSWVTGTVEEESELIDVVSMIVSGMLLVLGSIGTVVSTWFASTLGSLGSLVIFGNFPLGPKSGSSSDAPCKSFIFNSSGNISSISVENNTSGSTEPTKSNSVVTFFDLLALTTTSPRIDCRIPWSIKTARDWDGIEGVVEDR